MGIILAMATEFTKEQIAAFNDAFELFDRSGGKRLVAWTECANLARCFGYNPTNQYVLHLLGGDEIDTMPKSQLAERPSVWMISSHICGPSPKLQIQDAMKNSSKARRSSTKTVLARSPLTNSVPF